jgi:catechol 2,3-dioxygenase-like lactoylglutathione lyase family enzyme
MSKFKIEHIGISVKEPVKMANWYKNVLGFKINLSANNDDGDKSVAFISENENNIMLELFKLPEIPALCDSINHHLQLHIAFKSEDPEKDMEYLINNGAKFIEKCPVTMPGDYLIVLHDPWGNCIQLAKRNKKVNA